MKRSDLNLLIDSVAFCGFVLLTSSGVLMRYLLPPGSGRSATIWGMDRHEWGDLHFWISMLFLLILSTHLFLHWRAIVSLVTKRPGKDSMPRAGLGMVGVIALLALALAPLVTPVEQQSANAGPGSALQQRLDSDVEAIRGSMSLAEIAQLTDVEVASLIEALGLPKDTPADSKLGQLRREYGFSMDEARAAIAERMQ